MYNHSYKGYKNRKYKFRSDFTRSKFKGNKRSSAKNPEDVLAKLQIIRYTALVLAILITFAVLTIGLIVYNKDRTLPLEATESVNSVDYREELLRVVNKNNPLDSEYIPDLKKYKDYSVNVLAVESLQEMMNKAKADGVDLSVKCGYVSYEDQENLFQKEYERLLGENNSEVKAEAKAQAIIPKGGKSEYQTGLLISFATSEKGSFENTKASTWLEKNCVDYGFVLRYTEAKKSKTLMSADPTAYRYVGVKDAFMMRSLDMCLNEYSAYISVRE